MAEATETLNASGPGTVTSTTLSDGSQQMSYSDSDAETIYDYGDTWTFSGTASSTRTATFNWTSTLNYELYDAYASASAFSGSSSQQIYSENPEYTQTYSGSVTLDLIQGQNFGFQLYGTNYDYLTTLSGTFTVSEASVPEPASWAMMVGGFGLLGGVLRRKKAALSFA